MKTKALLLSFLALAFCASAQLSEFGTTNVVTTNLAYFVDGGRLVKRTNITTVAVVASGFCGAVGANDGYGRQWQSCEVWLKSGRAYEQEISADNGKTWKHSFVSTTRPEPLIVPRPPPPPRPDLTGKTMEERLAAMRAWNLSLLSIPGYGFMASPLVNDRWIIVNTWGKNGRIFRFVDHTDAVPLPGPFSNPR